ncbi:uncharacterized protein EI97DRAFT_372246 [Westerdykella ornata]|uniref:Copper acquisition factor BIM1-like domain-containing protein n=1 Tax=Westerdykella ornata TaxID=318751 RepID=A0A6A6JSA3_WESOR|nr:uncharacterized protein EI97DRAFT_372246 [Westerdykella ornata]KAF2279144.1 hypothetical protein EI97DRAFT_372246 [Westerdykella ornata]
MLDENLPTFFLKPTTDNKYNEAFYFTQHGTEPEATYLLNHLDPASQEARNTYAVALVDPHIPDVVYAEVLAKPDWSLPTLSQDEIRKNGGIAPPPQPIFPTEFAIQLYNPDQQVVLKQHVSKWTNAVSYEFSMPQTSFRIPSSSVLDRTQHDPLADPSAPKLNFAWRREGRIGKDMACYLTGKSTDLTGKKAKKSKEPDITIALFSSLKEMTIMEPNLYRVEMEDFKGLEVVLLLGAAIIRDIFFGNPREAFHIIDPATRKNSAGLKGKKGSPPPHALHTTPPVVTSRPSTQSPVQALSKAAGAQGLYSSPTLAGPSRASAPPIQTANQQSQRLDPRAQWEIDAETARLKAQAEAEAREQKRKEEKARKKAEEEEERKTRKFLEQEEKRRKQEEKERRRRQAEVDAETARLRKQFGDQTNLLPQVSRPQQPPRQGNLHPPSRPQQRHSAPLLQPPSRPSQRPPPQPARPSCSGPYLQPPQGPGHGPGASHSSFFGNSHSNAGTQPKMKKKSFWGLRSASDSTVNGLRKKQSSIMKTVAILALAGAASAHFRVEYPSWRGDSFADGASQWLFPCANVSETVDLGNRTQWPPTGGSIRLKVSHPWALTYVNLGLGTNVTSFNISLVDGFNQTGNGTFCLKETGNANIEEALKKANISAASLDGQQASLQIIQIAHSGASLYNCADITFNSSAPLLSDDECKNSTGVGGIGIQNADAAQTGTPTSPTGSTKPTGAAAALLPCAGGSVFAALVGALVMVM